MYPVIRMSQIQFREQKQSETLKGKTDSKLAWIATEHVYAFRFLQLSKLRYYRNNNQFIVSEDFADLNNLLQVPIGTLCFRLIFKHFYGFLFEHLFRE